jgi:hypothetical protein
MPDVGAFTNITLLHAFAALEQLFKSKVKDLLDGTMPAYRLTSNC